MNQPLNVPGSVSPILRSMGLALGAMISGWGSVFPVIAQEAPTSSPAATESEEDEEEVTFTEKLLKQPITTPSRNDATLGDATRPTYVINREQILQQGARTVKEALKFLPGILGDGTVGSEVNALSGQFIRGSNANQVLILLDGRPINNLGGGGFDLSEIRADIVERVEVLPGGGSTLYGSDAIGGVINIITRRPNKPLSIEGGVQFGSYGYNDQSIQVSGQVKDFSYFLGYNRTGTDNDYPFTIPEAGFSGTRRNNDVLYNNLTARLEQKIGDRITLSASTLYLNKNQGTPGGVPVPDPIFGQGFFNTLTDSNRKFTEQFLSDFSLKAKLGKGDNSILTARVYFDLLDTRFDNRTTLANSLSIVNGIPVLRPTPQTPRRFQTEQQSIGVQLQHNWKLAKNQTLTYGGDFRSTKVRNITQNLVTNLVTENYNDTVSQGALFAQYTIDFTPRFTVNAGIRQDFSSLSKGSATSPSIGAKFLVTETTTLRANYIRNFRVPLLANLFNASPTNIGNPDLKPERGNSFDIGIDQKLGNIGLLRLTYLNNTISDLIAFQRIAPPVNGISGTWQNLGKVHTQGLEASLNLKVARHVFLGVGYTLNDAKILESVNPNEAGKQLRFASADKLNVSLSYETPKSWYVGLLLNSLGGYPTNNVNTESLPGYTTLDLRFRVPITRNLKVHGGIQNLFDQRYQLFPGFPDGGRVVQAGLDFQF
ncbi:MAG: TonB-dependent receptor [Thermosynechococcaceae cyanobacterium MS004]|nr:TonB-dependent receptor [Thermosynechococcaceae cyanobacterium MS004]